MQRYFSGKTTRLLSKPPRGVGSFTTLAGPGLKGTLMISKSGSSVVVVRLVVVRLVVVVEVVVVALVVTGTKATADLIGGNGGPISSKSATSPVPAFDLAVVVVTTRDDGEQGDLGQAMKASSWQQWLLSLMGSPLQSLDTPFQNSFRSPCGSFSLGNAQHFSPQAKA